MGNSNCDSCGHDKRMCECKATFVAQEGGSHYQAQYQHWDWVTDVGMGYLPGNATKYVSRWRKKNGLADLKKAMTYVDKMIAIKKSDLSYKFNGEPTSKTRLYTDKFLNSNELMGNERSFCIMMAGDFGLHSLGVIRELLEELITTAMEAQEQAQAAGGTMPAQTASKPLLDKKLGGFGSAGGSTGGRVATSTSTGACINHPSPFGYQEETD